MAFLFFRQLQRMSDKQRAFLDALNRRVISERGDGKCYSSEWAMDNIVYKRRKLLSATPLLIVTFYFLLASFYYFVGPIYIIANVVRLGYAIVIALIGIAILVGTDAFRAYSYINAIHAIPTEQLDKEDHRYIELAREAVEKASLRFGSLGVAFALLGPFIPQIFNGVVYVLVPYTTVFFETSKVLFEVSPIFGFIVFFVNWLIIGLLTVLMLFFLPEFLSRMIIQRGKSLIRKLFKRRIEQ